MDTNDLPLADRVVLVAGATRGAGRGIAVALGAAGATVYCSGRSTRGTRSDYDRPETVEETAEMVTGAGGTGIASVTDHLDPTQVASLVGRIEAEHGRLDILVNDIGGEHYVDFGKRVWEYDLDRGLRLLRAGLETHLITSHFALGLLSRRSGGLVVEITDGQQLQRDALPREPVHGRHQECGEPSCVRRRTRAGPAGMLCGGAHAGLAPLGDDADVFGVTEENWRDATTRTATDGEPAPPGFAVSETPTMVGRAIAALAQDPDRQRWNQGSVTSFELAEHYGTTDVDGSRPDAWGYIVEVEEQGLERTPGDYR